MNVNKPGNKSAMMLLAAAVFLLYGMVACKSASRYPPPLSPEEAVKSFRFAEDFTAEIFAAEPLVVDPVSMEFDEEGNAYVVGMLDAYKPDSVKGKGKIVLLKDVNADGRADTAIVFADSLREASSILPWQGGLLIAAAPNIMYYKDTDGDGRADHKEILFTGFFTGNEEAQITNLRFGIDNWIYANNTGQAGEISFTRKPDAPKLIMKGADFRFRLDRNEFELTTGPGQFGLAIDDWGHRFFTTNSVHIRQVVIPRRYVERNPFLPTNLKSAIVNISDHETRMYQLTETPYWRQERTNRRNKDYKENKLDRVEYARDQFTGASGGTFYGGDAFPKEFYGNIFTADVAGSLVHRDILAYSDSVPFFTARRADAEKDKEFMATTDSWFRPANFSVGPDGNLYVIDMYRQHIETPMSIPDDLEAGMDFNAGNDMGRIYRIVAKNAAASPVKKFNLNTATAADLVALLSNNNQWWRLQAQRLLLDRQDTSVITEVKQLLTQSSDARTRLHALYVLEGLNALDAAAVKIALTDKEPGVRENAAILAEKFPECVTALLPLVEDSAIRVAFQATLSIGAFNNKEVVTALAKATHKHGNSSWFKTAVLSSEAGSSAALLQELIQTSFLNDPAEWKTLFCKDVCRIIGARNNKTEVTSLLSMVEQPGVLKVQTLSSSMLAGLISGFENIKDLSSEAKEQLKQLSSQNSNDAAKLAQGVKAFYSGIAR